MALKTSSTLSGLLNTCCGRPRSKWHEQTVRAGLLAIMIFVGISLVSSIIAFAQVVQFQRQYVAMLGTLGGVVITSVVLVIVVRAWQRQRRRMTLDYTHRIATQLSSMINEALVDVAERDNWSYLRLQATRLRLSAFPLYDPSGKHYFGKDR